MTEQEHQQALEDVIFRRICAVVVEQSVLADTQANRKMVLGFLHEDQNKQPTPEWFRSTILEPGLKEQLSWEPVWTPEQRKQAEARDKRTFEDAASTLRSFAVNEANFGLIRSKLGSPFTAYHIQKALASGALQLSPPS